MHTLTAMCHLLLDELEPNGNSQSWTHSTQIPKKIKVYRGVLINMGRMANKKVRTNSNKY